MVIAMATVTNQPILVFVCVLLVESSDFIPDKVLKALQHLPFLLVPQCKAVKLDERVAVRGGEALREMHTAWKRIADCSESLNNDVIKADMQIFARSQSYLATCEISFCLNFFPYVSHFKKQGRPIYSDISLSLMARSPSLPLG